MVHSFFLHISRCYDVLSLQKWIETIFPGEKCQKSCFKGFLLLFQLILTDSPLSRVQAAKAQSVEITRKITKISLFRHFSPGDFFENIFFHVLISSNDGICKKIECTTKVPLFKGSPLCPQLSCRSLTRGSRRAAGASQQE